MEVQVILKHSEDPVLSDELNQVMIKHSEDPVLSAELSQCQGKSPRMDTFQVCMKKTREMFETVKTSRIEASD